MGVGVGHAHLPCLAHGTGQTGAAKAAATHAICVHPSGLTKGRLECGDLWSADLPFGPNHGFLTSGFQPEAGSLAPAFSQAARFISRLYGRYIRNQNQNQTRLRGGTYLIHVHLDLDLIALSQRVALWIG